MNKHRRSGGHKISSWQEHALTIVASKSHQWMLKLAGKKYREKWDICIVSNYLSTVYLLVIKGNTVVTVEKDDGQSSPHDQSEHHQ